MQQNKGLKLEAGSEVRRIWKKYFEDMFNIDTWKQVVVHICGFNGIRGGNYFGREPIGKDEVEMRLEKLKNGKAAGKDEITRNYKRWWTRSGCYVVLCLKTRDLLLFFYCPRVKKR